MVVSDGLSLPLISYSSVSHRQGQQQQEPQQELELELELEPQAVVEPLEGERDERGWERQEQHLEERRER